MFRTFFGRKSKSELPTSQNLLEAILKNNHKEVRRQLEQGIDSNTSLSIGPSSFISDDETKFSENRMLSLEKAFLWKKILGETPTMIHVGVLNVYHRHNHQKGDVEKALQILDLLVEYGGDVSQCSINIFLRKGFVKSNPLDLAMGMQRMSIWMKMEKTEAAMAKAVAILKKERKSKPPFTTNKIPFELVSLPLVDTAKNFLFEKNDNPDLSFSFSDGGVLRSFDVRSC